MLLEELLPGEEIEDANTEFTGIIREGDGEEITWLRTLVAFSNTRGGRLYVGVEDKTHDIVALDRQAADEVSSMVHRQVRDKVEPALDLDIQPYPLSQSAPVRYVLRIVVNRGKGLPAVVHYGGLLGIYVRRSGRTETATSAELRGLILQSEHVAFDTPFTSVAFRREDFGHLLSLHRERTGEELTDGELVAMGFMSGDGWLSKGALLFRDDCADERTRMMLTHWPGDTKGSDEVLASQDYAGNLLDAIGLAQDFVSARSANGFRKTGRSRDGLSRTRRGQ